MAQHAEDMRGDRTDDALQLNCETCGHPITVKEGWLEWLGWNNSRGFRIVHNRRACAYFGDPEVAHECKDMHLDYFLGAEGLERLCSIMQHAPPKDYDAMISFFKVVTRLHATPHLRDQDDGGIYSSMPD